MMDDKERLLEEKLDALLSDYSRKAPKDFTARTMQRIRIENAAQTGPSPAKLSPFDRWSVWAGSTAAAAMLVLGVGYLSQLSPLEQQTQQQFAVTTADLSIAAEPERAPEQRRQWAAAPAHFQSQPEWGEIFTMADSLRDPETAKALMVNDDTYAIFTALDN